MPQVSASLQPTVPWADIGQTTSSRSQAGSHPVVTLPQTDSTAHYDIGVVLNQGGALGAGGAAGPSAAHLSAPNVPYTNLTLTGQRADTNPELSDQMCQNGGVLGVSVPPSGLVTDGVPSTSRGTVPEEPPTVGQVQTLLMHTNLGDQSLGGAAYAQQQAESSLSSAGAAEVPDELVRTPTARLSHIWILVEE